MKMLSAGGRGERRGGGGGVENDSAGREGDSNRMKFHFSVINSAYGVFPRRRSSTFFFLSTRNRGRPLFLLSSPLASPPCFGSRGLKELFIFLLREGELGRGIRLLFLSSIPARGGGGGGGFRLPAVPF